jgi:nucleoside phosphorylase
MKKSDILMVIPLFEEFEELKNNATVTFLKQKDTVYYYKVEFQNVNIQIVAIVLGMPGINNASSMTEKAIEYCKPRLIVLLGIAGGLYKGIGLGDVIIADKVNQFQMNSKAEAQGESFVLKFSGDPSDIPTSLVNFARNFSSRNVDIFQQWQNQVGLYKKEHLCTLENEHDFYVKEVPELLIGRIASGDTVGASKAYAEMVLSADRKHLALEMEAAGVCMAAKNRPNPIPVLVMRGISDLANEKKEKMDDTNIGIFRKYALFNVIHLLAAILDSEGFRETGIIRGRKIVIDENEATSQKQESESSKLSIIHLSPITNKIKDILGVIFEKISLTPDYYYLMPPIDTEAFDNIDHFVLWVLFENQPNFSWNHKAGKDLLEQYRKNIVLLLEKCDVPEQLSVFHKVDLSQQSDIDEQLNLLKSRMSTLPPETRATDLFVQTIIEELTMGKAEYSKKYPQVDKDSNIFAAMYFSAHCQEYEDKLNYLADLSRVLPRSSFTNLEFGQSTRETFKEIIELSLQTIRLVDIGLNIKPNDKIGRSTKLRCKEIIRMAQDDILPSVEEYLGSRGIPDRLSIQVHEMHTIMDGLLSLLIDVRDSLQMAYIESK